MIIPSVLVPKDKVALIATAKNFSPEEMKGAVKVLESWGLEVMTGKNLYKKWHQFAGTDEERAEDLQLALDSEDIKAIFCARGGYGTSRIIDRIDFSRLKTHPKLLIGFSDITVLLCHLNHLGIEALHAAMPIQFGKADYQSSISRLKDCIFGQQLSYTIPAYALNRLGTCHAPVIGGNLTILHTLLNTSSALDFTGKILFIEEVGEYLYHIDRMMVHFKRTGQLERLSGLIVGHFSEIKDNDVPFGKNAYEVIAESVASYAYPVIFNFPAGHMTDNFPLMLGRQALLKSESNSASLVFNQGGKQT